MTVMFVRNNEPRMTSPVTKDYDGVELISALVTPLCQVDACKKWVSDHLGVEYEVVHLVEFNETKLKAVYCALSALNTHPKSELGQSVLRAIEMLCTESFVQGRHYEFPKWNRECIGLRLKFDELKRQVEMKTGWNVREDGHLEQKKNR